MNRHKLFMAALLTSSLLVGCADNANANADDTNASVFDSFPAAGVFLPHSVLRDICSNHTPTDSTSPIDRVRDYMSGPHDDWRRFDAEARQRIQEASEAAESGSCG
ncbi:hypothetical protein CEK62_19595 [Alcanivorax sp. N3-2A]|nr:hypothetical protein CEK62_19595 [Alcanivorax sp. N3-2A]